MSKYYHFLVTNTLNIFRVIIALCICHLVNAIGKKKHSSIAYLHDTAAHKI